MADNLLSDRPDYDRTFNSVMWVVGTLAATLFFAASLEMLRRPAGISRGANRVAVGAPSAVAPRLLDSPSTHSGAGVSPPDAAAVFKGDGFPGGVPKTEGTDPVARNPANFPNLSQRLKPIIPGNIGGNAGGEFSSAGSRSRALSQPSILPEPSFSVLQRNDRSLSEILNAAQDSVEKIEDPVLDRLMAAGEELRAGGNPVGALDAFKQVESALPDHPRVLGGLAAT